MLTDTEKAALGRAAKLCEFHAVEWGVASGQNTVADAATLRALIERVGWQPIETAPRDGVKFDAWVPDAFGGHRMVNLSFNRKGQLRQHGLITPAELPRWPTHWMPLPTPPTE